MVRPESILYDEQGKFLATVEEAVYMGQNMQYMLSVDGVRFTMADYRCHVNGIFRIGDEIPVSFEEETLRLLADSER